MENDNTALIRELVPVDGLPEARREALDWVGEPNTETDITHIPGVYQAAMIEYVTGVQRFWNFETMGWWLPGSGGPGLIFTKYPPRTDEDRAEFQLMAISNEERSRLYFSFLRSPSVEAEMKRTRFG